MKEFAKYKQSQEDQFKAYQKAQMRAFEDYKKELGVFWDEPKLSTKDSWLSYSDDKKTRSDVNFEKNTITLETIATSEDEANINLQVALAKAVTVDTKTLQEIDPLEKRLSKIKKPFDVEDSDVDKKPILSTVIFDKEPTKESLKTYVKNKVSIPKMVAIESNKIEESKVYSIAIKLPDDTMIKRSKIYLDDVKKYAKKEGLPKALVFAIMHSESSFNPRARSHIPAYGLMQIVPQTAGRDTYKYLYKKDKLVSSKYLYNSKNNIQMGSAYLHILYYRYLRKIKHPTSRLYCAIAAYNTGSSNVAYAFIKRNNMQMAAPIINKLTPKQVYGKLIRDLKYDEPKNYLKKVSKRMDTYTKMYGL
ncbi:MAG: transglycosylase SLT domain-containing protein [Thiovulaceae bacterium]|nr:transglycosylase SLT domain-containing protein [Sulfurimonadaceae bacterium]